MLDFANFNRARRPNNYLVAPEGLAQAPIDAVAPVFSISPEDLKVKLLSVLSAEPRLEILENEGLALEVVQRTAVMRFPDFVSVRILPADAGATIAVYSRAKYGYRDFGVNQKRVENWLVALKKAAEAVS